MCAIQRMNRRNPAVIGMLGAALGYPVGDSRLEKLERLLRMGVRVERRG